MTAARADPAPLPSPGVIAPLISLIAPGFRHPENVMAVSSQIGTRTAQLHGAPGGGR